MRYSSEKRREQIINESINIIYERSFLKFTIRRLARRVGLSEAGIYRHFDSKDDIILQILERMNKFGAELAQKVAEIDNPLEKIKQFFLLQLEYFENNKEMAMILLSEEIFSNNEKTRQKFINTLNKRFDKLKELLAESAREGNINKSDIEEIALIIQGTMRGLVFRWNLNDYKFDLKERGGKLLNTILNNFKH